MHWSLKILDNAHQNCAKLLYTFELFNWLIRAGASDESRSERLGTIGKRWAKPHEALRYNDYEYVSSHSHLRLPHIYKYPILSLYIRTHIEMQIHVYRR